MKKVLLTIMTMFLPLMASADYSGSCGDNVTWYYEESTHTLTISGSGEMWDLWGEAVGISDITTVIIEPGVTSIGGRAFYGCTGLTSVTIPNTVTSIGGGAFYGCIGLTSVIIPEGVTSIGNGTFRDCTGLTSVIIPEGVKSIDDRAFEGCTRLTSVNIPESATSIGDGAFRGCTSLTSMPTLPTTMTAISPELFCDCAGFSSVTIPDGIVSIGSRAFDGCTGITSVTIPNTVTSIDEYAFCDCEALTSIVIPNSVTSIGRQAFSWCYGLTSVTLGRGVTSIGYSAFEGCGALKEICSLIQEPFTISYDTFQITDSQTNTFKYPYAILYVPAGTRSKYVATPSWNEFRSIVEMTVVSPVEDVTTVNTESLSGQNLTDNVVDGVYYNLGSDGYDASDGSIVINQPTDISKLGYNKPGTGDVKNKFTGIIFKVAVGKGTITVKVKTSGNAQLAVKVGNGAPTTASKSEKGDVVVNYDVTEESYVYIYSTVSGSGTRASSNDVVKIYGLTVRPDATGIAEVKREPIANNRYYTLDGRQVVGKPTAKGIYILNGRKVVMK